MSPTLTLSRGHWPRVLALAVTLAAAVIATLTLAPRANADFSTAQCQGPDIIGQGASFARDAHGEFRFSFEAGFCPSSAPTVTYQPDGSGAGRRSMGERSMGNGVDNRDGSQARSQTPRFGMTDEAPTPGQQAQMETGSDTAGDESDVHVVPAAVGAVAPLVNFPNGCDVNKLDPLNKTDDTTSGSPATSDQVVRVRFTKQKLEAAWNGGLDARNWDDLFTELDGVPGCDVPIIRVVRFDDSGTTFTFKDYLDSINPARGWLDAFAATDPAKTRAWPNATFGPRPDCPPVQTPSGPQQPVGPGIEPDTTDQLTSQCAGNAGNLVTKLKATDGSIGYADVSTSRTADLAIAPKMNDNDVYWTQAQNGSVDTDKSNSDTPAATGAFTEPTVDPRGFRTDGRAGANCGRATFNNTPASTLGDWSQTSGVDSPNGYGICTFTYGLLFDDYAKAYALLRDQAAEEAKARTVKDYWTHIVSDGGQAVLFPKDYSPLPSNIQTIAQAGVAAVNYNKSGTSGGGGGGTGGGGTTNTGGTNNTGGGGTPAPAVSVRSNVFSVPRTTIDSRKGTATFRVRLPDAGVLRVLGTAKKPAAKRNKRKARRGSVAQGRRQITVARVRLTVAKAGVYTVVLKPGRAAKRILRQRGRLRVAVQMTYTPIDTASRTSTRTVTLKLRRPAKKKGNRRG